MLKIQHRGPPLKLAEVIEFLQTLPPEMVCTHRLVEFEPRAIFATTLSDTSPANGGIVVQRIELTLESLVKTE